MAETLIIVNPRSANGRAGRNWQRIEALLRARLPFPSTALSRNGRATRRR